jgi:hypothetical protein
VIHRVEKFRQHRAKKSLGLPDPHLLREQDGAKTRGAMLYMLLNLLLLRSG